MEEHQEHKSEEPTGPQEPMRPVTGGPETSTGLDPKVAALLAYLFGWVGGLIIYLVETKNKYARFHALQSIFLNVAVIVVYIALGIVFGIVGAVPGLGLAMFGLASLIYSVLGLGVLVLWIFLMVKAYQGEKYMLPVIGEMADRSA